MTGEERLEEIKQQLLAVDKIDMVHRDKMLDYRHWAYELLKISNEQAERVRELEKRLKIYQKRSWFEDYEKVAKQNKRYRNLLEKIDYLLEKAGEADENVYDLISYVRTLIGLGGGVRNE